MADSDIFSLAKVLGAKNLTNNSFANSPAGRNFILQNERADSAEKQLQSTTTPLGALSSGIALYVQRKREGKALEELNAQMQAEQEAKAARRESLINALPEANRVIGNALEDKDLPEYLMKTLTPTSEEDKLALENKRLQNQKLQKEISSSGSSASNKPLPPVAVKLQNEALDIIGASSAINADLATIRSQLETKQLKLGPVENIKSRVKNTTGYSDEQSRNFASFKATLEKLRNESLRLNKGVQTEGDAKRIWDEILVDINDEDLVKQRLGEVEKINERGADLQKLQVDQIRANYGAQPLDYSQFAKQPAALGTAGKGNNASQEKQGAVAPQNDKKQALKNKYGLN